LKIQQVRVEGAKRALIQESRNVVKAAGKAERPEYSHKMSCTLLVEAGIPELSRRG
jgi:hypothetical protein